MALRLRNKALNGWGKKVYSECVGTLGLVMGRRIFIFSLDTGWWVS
mgnify:CR=1 FL=1